MYTYAKKSDLDVVASNYFEDDENNSVKHRVHDKLKDVCSGEEYLKRLFSGCAPWRVWSYFFKRSLYLGVKHPVGINLGEDLVATTKLVSKAKRVKRLDKAYVHYMNNPNSITRFELSKILCQCFKAIDEVERYLRENKKDEQYKCQLSSLRNKVFTIFITCKPFYMSL